MVHKEPVRISELSPATRNGNFDEVISGYTEEEALCEAKRCLQCKKPFCTGGCPVGIDIKTFISQLTNKDYAGAYFTIRQKSNFPSICGRVCPAEYQCRKACILTKRGQPFASREAINIHFLERFIGDYGMKNKLKVPSVKNPKLSGMKVAVVGSGPAGLCCAGELSRQGIHVTIFESLHKTGGVLRYGIPPFRLPRNILDFEIEALRAQGVQIETNFIIGKALTVAELLAEGYSAIFLGLGAGVPSFLGIPGENLCNIYSANEFLTRVNLMKAYKFPEYHTPVNIGKHIIVIGGGNTAMDAARCALRMQIMNGMEPNTTVVYRRSEVELPARRLEIEHAKEEGVQFNLLVQPLEFTGDEHGYVKKMKGIKCELGEPDASGRRKPVPVKGSEFELPCDVAILAIGLKANILLTSVTPELSVDRYGDVTVSSDTMETSIKSVYAGGDIVGGEGTVIEAMGMAKKAAKAIVEDLSRKAGVRV